MPNVTIYLSADLAEQVRRHQVPISATCQTALARKARAAQLRERAQASKAGPAYNRRTYGRGAAKPAA